MESDFFSQTKKLHRCPWQPKSVPRRSSKLVKCGFKWNFTTWILIFGTHSQHTDSSVFARQTSRSQPSRREISRWLLNLVIIEWLCATHSEDPHTRTYSQMSFAYELTGLIIDLVSDQACITLRTRIRNDTTSMMFWQTIFSLHSTELTPKTKSQLELQDFFNKTFFLVYLLFEFSTNFIVYSVLFLFFFFC